jgi:hypothetical protein
MSLEAALAENSAALNRNSDYLERVIAGQEAALAKLGDTKPAKPKPATVAAAPAAAPVAAAEPEIVETGSAPTDSELKAAAVAWMDGKSKEERTEAAKFINDTLAWMGFAAGAKLTGPDATLTAAQRKQAKFFIERWAGGLSVDFKADYDFDGPVDQGAEVEADPFG